MAGGVIPSTLVGHRSHAMKPRQPRQVRKEATVTGRFVRSELPVSGFSLAANSPRRKPLPLLIPF